MAMHCNLVFDVREQYLVGLQIDPSYPKDQSRWKEVLTIPILKHYYLEKGKDNYNRETNEIVEDSSRSYWKNRTHIKFDFSGIKILEEEFKKRDYKLCFGGSDNHLLLIDVTHKGVSGKQAQIALDKAGITVNKNMIPDDIRSPMDPSGIRLGTPAITTRGMKENEMKIIAAWIDEAITNWENDAKLADIKKQVAELTKKFPLYSTL